MSGWTSCRDCRASHEVQLYHIIVEALNNVIKHAAATRVTLHLTRTNGYLHLRITDDGQGFDPAQTTGGMGLRNIRERVARLERPDRHFQPTGRRHAVRGDDSLSDGGSAMTDLIRILIADDHFVVRQGLVTLVGASQRHGGGG